MSTKGWIGVGWFTVILFTILGLYLYQTMKDGSHRTLANQLERSGIVVKRNSFNLSYPGIKFETLLEKAKGEMQDAIEMAYMGSKKSPKLSIERMTEIFKYMQQHHGYSNADIQNLIDKIWGECNRPYDSDQYMVFHWTLDYMYKPFD